MLRYWSIQQKRKLPKDYFDKSRNLLISDAKVLKKSAESLRNEENLVLADKLIGRFGKKQLLQAVKQRQKTVGFDPSSLILTNYFLPVNRVLAIITNQEHLSKMDELDDLKIKEFLETTPLYSWKSFKLPQMNRSSLRITEIDSFCDNCEQHRPFHDLRSYGGGAGEAFRALSSGTSYFEFTCVSCRKQRHEYLVEQIVTESDIKLQKYGELPRKKLDRDKILQKFFSDDSEYYEKSVVCLSHGFGVAAFAYMRRIVENNIDKLLDMIQEDNNSTDSNSEVISALEELKKQSPMSDKISVANKALPKYLQPDGLNPLGRLYQILSEGVHSLSDSDCLERANKIQNCLKYLISELSTRKVNRAKFKSMVGSL